MSIVNGRERPSRRRVLGASLALVGGLAAPSILRAATPVKIRLGLFKGSAQAAQIARNRGDFERAGIQLDLTYLGAGPSIVMATAREQVDIGYGDTFAWVSGMINGFDNVRLIAPSNTGQGWLTAPAGRHIKLPQDLTGLRVALTPTPFPSTLVRSWARRQGGNPDTLRLSTIPVGGQAAALRTGDVDAVFTYEFITTQKLLHDGGVPLADLNHIMPAGAPSANYYTSDGFIARYPEAVVSFVRLVRAAAADFAAASPQEKARLLGPIANVDFNALTAEIPDLLKNAAWPNFFARPLNVSAIQEWIDMGTTEGALPRKIPIDGKIFWTATTANLSA